MISKLRSLGVDRKSSGLESAIGFHFGAREELRHFRANQGTARIVLTLFFTMHSEQKKCV
jgi:hypothetical protein